MDEAYFRAAHAADARNGAKQSVDEYLGWVKTFYEGKRFPPVPGWHAREHEILGRLPADARAPMTAALAETGRVLAAEWAKDNAVRRVSTGDLQAWGKRFADAARDPAALVRALDEVRAHVRASSLSSSTSP